MFSDSLEVDSSDWTPNFLDEFRKRRGYDLTARTCPRWPATSETKTMAIRHDWGKTLTELADENYLTPIREWAHAAPHAVPLADLRRRRRSSLSSKRWRICRKAKARSGGMLFVDALGVVGESPVTGGR